MAANQGVARLRFSPIGRRRLGLRSRQEIQVRHGVADPRPFPHAYGGRAVLLSVSTTVTPEHTTVHAAGEVDLDTVELLRGALADALHDGATHVVADLDHVTFLDSTGLGALVGAHKRARAAGGRLTVRTSQPQVVQLLEITALTRLLDVQTDAPASARVTSLPR